MKQTWIKWFKGLVSAAIGGAANAVTASIVSPETFNFGDGLNKMLVMAGAGSLLAAAMYLKQSPLPETKADQVGTGVLEVIVGIFLAIGALVYAIAGDDDVDPECYAAQNAAYYAQVELEEVTCSGNDCTVMISGMPLKLNCSCEAHGACRRAE